MKKVLLLFLANTLLFCFGGSASAQTWNRIVPLISTCEQLKEFLPIKECNGASSKLDTSEYYLKISYSTQPCQEGEQWNVPKGTVIRVLFNPKPFIRLTDYGDVKDYVMKPEDDLPDYKTYTNEKLGIGLTVLDDENHGELIQNIFLFPSTENKNKFKCGQKVVKKKSRKKIKSQ